MYQGSNEIDSVGGFEKAKGMKVFRNFFLPCLLLELLREVGSFLHSRDRCLLYLILVFVSALTIVLVQVQFKLKRLIGFLEMTEED